MQFDRNLENGGIVSSFEGEEEEEGRGNTSLIKSEYGNSFLCVQWEYVVVTLNVLYESRGSGDEVLVHGARGGKMERKGGLARERRGERLSVGLRVTKSL